MPRRGHPVCLGDAGLCGCPGDLAGDPASLESRGLSWALRSGGGVPRAAGRLLGVAPRPHILPAPLRRPSPFIRQVPHLGVHTVQRLDQDPAVARSALGPADGGHPCPASWGAGVEGRPGGWADSRPAPQAESSRRLGHPQIAPPAVRLPSLGEGLLQFRERITDGFLTSRKPQAGHQEHSLSTAHLGPPWAEPPGGVGRAI